MNYFLNDDVKVAPNETVKVHDSRVKIDFEFVDVAVANLTVVCLIAAV